MKELWDRLNPLQLCALAVLVTGAVVALIFVPADRWQVIISILGMAGVGTGGIIGGPLVRTPEGQAAHEARRARRREGRELARATEAILSEPPEAYLGAMSSADTTPPESIRAIARRDAPPASRPPRRLDDEEEEP